VGDSFFYPAAATKKLYLDCRQLRLIEPLNPRPLLETPRGSKVTGMLMKMTVLELGGRKVDGKRTPK